MPWGCRAPVKVEGEIFPGLCVILLWVPQGRAVRALLPILGQPSLHPLGRNSVLWGLQALQAASEAAEKSQAMEGWSKTPSASDFALLGGKD